MDIREKLLNRLDIPGKLNLRPGLRMNRRWSALVAVLILVSATAAYALRQALIQPDPGLQKMLVENQVVQIDQTQPVSAEYNIEPLQDVSITLDYAYADSNRVAAAYQVTGTAAAGTAVQVYSNPTLVDADERSYPWLPNSFQQITETQAGTAGELFTLNGLMSFDASGVDNAPDTLHLKLRIDMAFTTAETRSEDQYLMMGAGETTFEFEVPFNPGRTITVGQSAPAGDLTVEVQKVVIAPSLTRVDLCLSSSTPFAVDQWLSWESPVTLDVNGERILTDLAAGFTGLKGEPLHADSPCRALNVPDALTEHLGQWVLTLDRFENKEAGITLPGPWTFTFDVN
ncbi:MAG: hypothetical protein HY866_20495 [Chloroflexi bacterium]|nr:hypothetical protein [Chloroflexota bacterium]